MDFEIKQLKENIRDHYKEIGDLYHETYFKDYFEGGALNWEEKYAEYYFNAFHFPPDYYFTAWKDDKLIATSLGSKYPVFLDGEIELTGVSIGLTATKPEYQRQGIQKKLISELIKAAKKDKVDFIWAFPQIGKFGDKLLKDHFNFVRYNKNAEHLIKILGDHGRWILQNYRGLNAALARLAVIYAGIPKEKLMGGEIREGDVNSNDIKAVVDIINSYTKRLPLSRTWTEEKYKNEIIKSKEIVNYYPDWRYFWLVWERDGEIIASINIRTEYVTFEKGTSTVGLITNSVFKEGLTDDEKISFFAPIIRRFYEEKHEGDDWRLKKLFTLQTTQPQYEPKMYKKAKCTDDQSKYEFLILPLTKKGEQIGLRYKKIKKLFIPYHR
ncbi:MAG: GNAT family N-acetyltransferase [Candidatus Helarchaeota archaeon]